MNMIQAVMARNSVRSYTEQKIEEGLLMELRAEVDRCNAASGLHIQLVENEPDAFSTGMARYGKFSQANNYLAMIGKSGPEPEEAVGYWGEQIVLTAQQLGLNTCWVALTFNKGKAKYVMDAGEKLACVISIGYGKTQGVPHKSKPVEALCRTGNGAVPEWFKKGVDAAMLAPTAMNQQKFLLTLTPEGVVAKSTGGFYSRMDLGIVKKHFEIGAGIENFKWV